MKNILFVSIFLYLFLPQSLSYAQLTTEASPLIIKGSRIFNFQSKSLDGTKEGYLPGVNREESLRINISGDIKDTHIDANFFASSVNNINSISSAEEKMSISLKNGSNEAFFGDFTEDFGAAEFLRINKTLSGLELKGSYNNLSYKLIASSPRGQPKLIKLYGNASQGPYNLGASPVVVDSEKIYLDNVLQKRGDDYTIDYQAGTITFKNKTIDKISIIEAYFDYRQTPYTRSTYAALGDYIFSDNIRLGGGYIDDSDSLKDAEEIFSSASIEPQSHYVAGLDYGVDFGDIFSSQGEFAYSYLRPTLLSNNEIALIGKAGVVSASSVLGPLSFSGMYKKTGPQFLIVGDAQPKQAITEYSGNIKFQPFNFFMGEADIDESRYIQNNVFYNNSLKSANAELTLLNLPSIGYYLSDHIESNDPVTSLPFDRLTTDNTLSIKHSIGFLKGEIFGNQEKRIVRYPSEEATIYNKVNASLSMNPGDFLNATGNVELKQTKLPSGAKPLTRTAILNFQTSPIREYMLSGNINYIKDDQDGIRQAATVSFKAEPIKAIKTSGKYSINTLLEAFGTTNEGTKKEEGFINLELRPIESIKLKYSLKPTFTVLSRTSGITNSNDTKQFEANIFLSKETLLGFSNQLISSFIIDKTDWPNYKRIASLQDSSNTIYSIKTAPLKFLSCEFNYILGDSKSLSLSASTEASQYLTQNQNNREINAEIKTSLSQKIAFDCNASYKINKLGSNESINNLADSDSKMASLKIIFNPIDLISVSPYYSFTQSTDNLAATDNITYTLGPGFEFTIKSRDLFRIDGSYSYQKSHAGAATEKTNYKLQGRYDLAAFVHITLRTESEISHNPDYKISEFSGSVEINL